MAWRGCGRRCLNWRRQENARKLMDHRLLDSKEPKWSCEAAARRLVDRLPRPASPPSASPPPPPPDPMPDVSETAYAVLRGPEGELHELPGLENVIGRSTACDTCIPGSQVRGSTLKIS